MIRWALLLALAGVRLMIFDGNHKPSSKEIAERQPLRNRRGECRIRFVRPYWKLQPIVTADAVAALRALTSIGSSTRQDLWVGLR